MTALKLIILVIFSLFSFSVHALVFKKPAQGHSSYISEPSAAIQMVAMWEELVEEIDKGNLLAVIDRLHHEAELGDSKAKVFLGFFYGGAVATVELNTKACLALNLPRRKKLIK